MAIRRLVPVAREGEVPVGRTKSFRFGMSNGIVYNDAGTLKAYVNRCTHMGGPVRLMDGDSGPNVFRCQWHMAEFNPKTGEAIEGQAPRGTFLTPVALEQKDGEWFGVLELPDDPFAF